MMLCGRTMGNMEDMSPEAPGAPSRRRHDIDPDFENFTRMEVKQQ
jgi:hypothetical protein